MDIIVPPSDIRYQPDEPSYSCPKCLDAGYTSHNWKRSRVSWFCTRCTFGERLESYHWFELHYPEFRGHRRKQPDKYGQQAFEKYCIANPQRGVQMKSAMRACLESYNRELTARKIQEASQE